jgi:L-ascorbate metabolism protein UlaG (beta-lactamase superfamily)
MNCTQTMSVILAGVLCAFSLSAPADDRDDDDDDDRGANPALMQARQKLFGIENVDRKGRVKKDKVIASWATNTTYAVSVRGRVILLDSYINRPELPTVPLDKRRTPFLPQDLVAAKPEAIFLGHGHGDHAHHGAYIAKMTGATIYASAETCDVMQADVIRMFNDPNLHNGGAKIIPNADPVKCVAVAPVGSRPGGYDENRFPPSQPTRLHQLDPQVCILAFKFIHSGTAPVDASFPHTPLSNLGDPRYAGRVIETPLPAITYPAMFPVGTPYIPPNNVANRVPGQINTNTSGVGVDGVAKGGAITMFYQFVLRGDDGSDFSFAWVNSAGPATEGIGSDPGLVTLAQYNDPVNNGPAITLAGKIGASLFDLIDRLPGTDVFFGSIVSLGAANNQQRDIIKVIQHLKPKVYYPGHVTDVAQAGSVLYHKINWRETALNMGFPQSEWPEFRAQIDPNDFLVPQVFDPSDKRWSKSRGDRDRHHSQCR